MLPESFGTVARELLFACCLLGGGLVLHLHPISRLNGGELADRAERGELHVKPGTELRNVIERAARHELTGDEAVAEIRRHVQGDLG